MASPVDQETALRGKDLQIMFRVWEEKHQTPGFDPVPFIVRLAEIFEEEMDIYLQKDPDPFDERHPSRTDPECELGRKLKLLFRKDNFMTRLVNDYLRDNFFTRQSIQKSSLELNIASCRLILVIMPGLETSAVFQPENDNLINRLYSWATDSPEPLQSYATGLLAAAMEVQDIAIGFREQNARLVPLMLTRLHNLQKKPKDLKLKSEKLPEIPTEDEEISNEVPPYPMQTSSTNDDDDNILSSSASLPSPSTASSASSPRRVGNGISKIQNRINLMKLLTGDVAGDNSGTEGGNATVLTSSYRIARNTISFHDPTLATSQMLILRYLTPMGEYQEFLVHVFEYNAMQLIFRYIENLNSKDTCLAFESLKYLAALLCHKKFCLEFINNGGLERLLFVPRPSVAATGVSISLYYLAYCEDAMERICNMPKPLISELVTYALWLLGCSHDSGRCHATMFFGLAFQFKVILDEFDAQDGLRKLYNVISVLPILSLSDEVSLNDDEQCASRQIVRHVCTTFKKYMESHLYFKYTQVTRQNNIVISNTPAQPTLRACVCSSEVITEQVRSLQEILPMRAYWAPVDELIRLGGIALLVRIIACAYEWNYTGRAEIVRSILDTITVCCAVPKVHHVLCDRIELPDDNQSAGFNVILGAAEGEIATDVDVQKAALAVLIQCVCAPIHRPTGSIGRYGSVKKKTTNKSSEELIQKVWECVRSNNGIIVLLQLMQIKNPITDADCIRGMACRALAGLSRSETVRQIMSKLPLFANGQLQSLMRDPILQEKRADHVMFQKYALELIERVSGKTKTANNDLDSSLAIIHRANVVAQTRIHFNETQLYQLINDFLISKGLNDTAASLQKESGMCTTGGHNQRSQPHHSPFSYKSPSVLPRQRMRSKQADFIANLSSGSTQIAEPPALQNPTELLLNGKASAIDDESHMTPIKIIKKMSVSSISNTIAQLQQQCQRSLQKQISSSTGDGFTPAAPQPPRSNQNDIASSSHKQQITLDTIITEYLTNQHALCKNPMSTCPQFDLFVPHKCPDPHANKVYGLSTNFAARFFRRQAGFNSRRLDRRLVHSNYSVVRNLRSQDSDLFFTSCTFTACSTNVIVGSYNGDVKVFNINQSTEEYATNCHDSYINSIKCNREGNLVVISSTWRPPMSTLWNIENRQFSLKLQWEEEEYCEFNNTLQDKILGTKSQIATIYDLNTGQKISQFAPTNYNQYSKNRATFNPTDDLILSDGVLWDVRSGKDIHKFDKLNQTISGVFHPNGLEIVSNTEVWDLRTFHLLRTVPILDQCFVTFSPQNVIYGICPELDSNQDYDVYTYDSNFKTLDSYDYSSIATIDVKRNIYDMCVNKTGSQIAIVENQGSYDSRQESVIRIYNVGRKKNSEDDAEEEEEEIEGSDEGSMSDTDSVVIPNGRRRLRDLLNVDHLFNAEIGSTSADSSDSDNEDDNDDDDVNDNDDDDEDNDNDDDDFLMFGSNSDSD